MAATPLETPGGNARDEITADADVDSAYADSEHTDTDSLRSWILDYRVENNRTYHVVSPLV